MIFIYKKSDTVGLKTENILCGIRNNVKRICYLFSSKGIKNKL